MNLLSAENITKTFTGRKLFSNASFICRKERKSELWELTEPENPLY